MLLISEGIDVIDCFKQTDAITIPRGWGGGMGGGGNGYYPRKWGNGHNPRKSSLHILEVKMSFIYDSYIVVRCQFQLLWQQRPDKLWMSGKMFRPSLQVLCHVLRFGCDWNGVV